MFNLQWFSAMVILVRMILHPGFEGAAFAASRILPLDTLQPQARLCLGKNDGGPDAESSSFEDKGA